MWILIYYIIVAPSLASGASSVATDHVEFTSQQKCEQAATSLVLNKSNYNTRIKVMCVAK